MDFVHRTYEREQTVAAIATAVGEGGVAIIRLSGKNAVNIAASVFSGPVKEYKTHTVHFGKVLSSSNQPIDEALLLVMRAPNSFTGEDVVEIQCHGGTLIARKVLNRVLEAGAEPAGPGEFTFRAFMNGKMDLAQAEAVQSLIHAKNEYALNAAHQQLEGALSKKIAIFKKNLTQIAAIFEAWVDFPDEGLEFASMEEVCKDLEDAQQEMKNLLNTFHDGKMIQEGVSVALIGTPNVGKSSLMNALLDKERAIVSPIPGTTRDLVEDQFRLNGLNIHLTDTAGIREVDEWVEQEGIRRSKKAMERADLVLLVLDAHRLLSAEDETLLKEAPPKKTVVVWNKTDLPYISLPPLSFPHVVKISAKKNEGIEELKKEIDRVIWKNGTPDSQEVFLTNARHKTALQEAIIACEAVLVGLKNGTSPEFLTSDLRLSLSHLGTIIGSNIQEDILSAIFSTFCIGK